MSTTLPPTVPGPLAHQPEAGAHPPGHGATGVASLSTVLIVTWINSMATGIPYNGIFYICKNVYGFTAVQSGLMGVLLGVTYIAGALGTGPLVRGLIASGRVKGARDVLAGLALLMAGLCVLPIAVFFSAPEAERASGAWSAWVFMGLYSALCGGFWPIVEAFLAGGRTAKQLRGATGKFNITWSSALIASMWAMVPFDAASQVIALGVTAFLHVLSLAWLLRLPRKPGEHSHETHRVPESYHVLLPVHRVLLPVVYLVMYALSPVLPALIQSLGVGARWEPAVGSAWLAARVATFGLLERWHGWHGKWITATVGMLTLVAGFVLAVTSPLIAQGPAGVAVLVAGLLVFGVGAASIYCAALYYAMEVGAAEVEAGGMHEAMIGVGYTLGPIATLAPALMARASQSGAEPSKWVLIGIVGGMTGVGVVLAAGAARRARNRLGRVNRG